MLHYTVDISTFNCIMVQRIGEVTMLENNKVHIVDVHLIDKNILSVVLEGGRIEGGIQIPYNKQPGDRILKHIDPTTKVVTGFRVMRNSEIIGSIVGGEYGKILYTEEKVVGSTLLNEKVTDLSNFIIQSNEDKNYDKGVFPINIFQKSKPSNMTEPGFEFVMQHILYLILPYELKEGLTYTVNFGELNVDSKNYIYVNHTTQKRSDAIHVTQLGYRPSNKEKCAFLSTWLGTGGPLNYQGISTFHLIDCNNNTKAFSGNINMVWDYSKPERMGTTNKNNNHTNVYKMEFGDFNRSGCYKIYIEGIGCSYSFDISDHCWEKAFMVSMKGFYNHRSGIELGKPYSNYSRPKCHHKDNGIKIIESTTPLMNTGNGLNIDGDDVGNFRNLTKGKIDKIFPPVWGGYFDAGDWDRRINHIDASILQMELMELYPEYFEKLHLNIPESGNGLPDLINEVLWNLDFYTRLQTDEGGIRGGIESEEHPRQGETSWQDSLMLMAYAPCIWSSYVYAGAAAKASYLLKNRNIALSEKYKNCALKAMNWAENEYRIWEINANKTQRLNNSVERLNKDRSYATIELYRLTNNEKWHDIFLETRRNNHNAATFLYSRLPDELVDIKIKEECIKWILECADNSLLLSKENAYNIVPEYEDCRIGFFYGYFSTPYAGMNIARAHYLTKDEKYRNGLIKACQYGTGANPLNLSYTTGVGENCPKNILHIDSRRTKTAPPEGITIYGNYAPLEHPEFWNNKMLIDRGNCVPALDIWPVTETYFDIYYCAPMCEWTIDGTMGPNSYVWGYLAAVN